jgi:hypothetical protein
MQFVLAQPCGPFYQLASLSFIAGGLFADLLIVRLMLTFAYTFMLANVLAGFPRWPRMTQGEPFTLSVDAIVWAVLGVYVHGSSLFRLLYEERHVSLAEDEEVVGAWMVAAWVVAAWVVAAWVVAGVCASLRDSAGHVQPVRRQA